MLPRLSLAPDAVLPAPASAGKAPLDRWKRAPASAWHNMTDEELLWAASWRPSVRRYPYRRTPKVAFMFLTRGPLPLAPLWDRFFVGAFDDPGPAGRGRYRAGLAPEVRREQFRKGAQWFELDRELAVDVVADERYYPKFREHCRPPCYVDEHYLPTALSIEAPARIANRSVTWVDWSRGGAHPATFAGKDVDEAFLKRLTAAPAKQNCTYNGQPSEVCFLFARKFAPSTLRPLLRLAPKLLGYG